MRQGRRRLLAVKNRYERRSTEKAKDEKTLQCQMDCILFDCLGCRDPDGLGGSVLRKIVALTVAFALFAGDDSVAGIFVLAGQAPYFSMDSGTCSADSLRLSAAFGRLCLLQLSVYSGAEPKSAAGNLLGYGANFRFVDGRRRRVFRYRDDFGPRQLK